MFIVKLENNGLDFLKGTTWTCAHDRAFIYESYSDAKTALFKAKQFMKLSVYKLAKIVEGN